jgi:PHD/YefM family antitoxin component YafN of YafNO toxin-antitoxin module
MRTVSTTDVRTLLPDLLSQVKCAGINATPLVIRRHLEPMAVLISFEQFDDYRALSAYRSHELQRESRKHGAT